MIHFSKVIHTSAKMLFPPKNIISSLLGWKKAFSVRTKSNDQFISLWWQFRICYSECSFCKNKHIVRTLERYFVNEIMAVILIRTFWATSCVQHNQGIVWHCRSQSLLLTSTKLVPPTPITTAWQEVVMENQKYVTFSQAFKKKGSEQGEQKSCLSQKRGGGKGEKKRNKNGHLKEEVKAEGWFNSVATSNHINLPHPTR